MNLHLTWRRRRRRRQCKSAAMMMRKGYCKLLEYRCNNNNMEDISAIYKDVFLDRSQVLDAKFFPLALGVCVQKNIVILFSISQAELWPCVGIEKSFSILEELRMHFFVLICLFSDLLEFVLKLLAEMSLW